MSRDDQIQIVRTQLFIHGKWQHVYIVVHINVSGQNYIENPIRFIECLAESTRYTWSLETARKVARAMNKKVYYTEYGIEETFIFETLKIVRKVDLHLVRVVPCYVLQMSTIPWLKTPSNDYMEEHFKKTMQYYLSR